MLPDFPGLAGCLCLCLCFFSTLSFIVLIALIALHVVGRHQPFFPEFRGTTRNAQNLRGGRDCDAVYLTLTGVKRVWGWLRADEAAGRPE